MGANPHANGGLLLRELDLPDFREYGVDVPAPARTSSEATRVLGAWLRDAIRANGDRFRAKTGLPLATYFSALKIRWILDNVPGVRARAEAGHILFGNMDTFLTWKLSGGTHVTDCTNASRTQLMNLATLDWDQELLDAFRIPRACLPRNRQATRVSGRRCQNVLRTISSVIEPVSSCTGSTTSEYVPSTAGRNVGPTVAEPVKTLEVSQFVPSGFLIEIWL